MEDMQAVIVSATTIALGNVLSLIRGISQVGGALRVVGFVVTGLLIRGINAYSDFLILASSIVGVITAYYTYSYSLLKYRGKSLAPLVDVFLFSMIMVFRSNYFFELVTFWLLTELVAFFLIAYDYIVYEEPEALSASMKYLLFSMIPTDLALFTSLALAGFENAFLVPLQDLKVFLDDPVVTTILILGFFAKAAIIPLHFWLPDAHSVAPSPASSLLSGVMVKMGTYALYYFLLQPINTAVATTLIIFFGSLTSVYGALQASIQEDVKRLLAYSTTSETGVIALLLCLYASTGDQLFLEASIVYTVAHMFYKSYMFMDAGFIEITTRTRSLSKLGFLRFVSPLQAVSAVMAIVAYLGMPPSTGFLAKLFVFSSLAKYVDVSLYLVLLLVVTLKVTLSVIYNARYVRAYFGLWPREDFYVGEVWELKLVKVTCLAGSLSLYLGLVAVAYPGAPGLPEFTLLGSLGSRLLMPLLVVPLVSYVLVYLLVRKG